jgi:hypothetical protein
MGRYSRFYVTPMLVVALTLTLAGVGLSLAGCAEEVPPTTTTEVLPVEKILAPGEDWAITESTELDALIIGEGATITPPPGKSVTLTVNGEETGQRLETTGGYDLVFVPGAYTGEVVLTVADANPVEFTPMGHAGSATEPIVHPFRQAICVDENGFSESKSVLAAISGADPTARDAENLTIRSTGECFSGIYAASSYSVDNVEINLAGNGRSDFSGYGAAVVGTGESTTLVLDSLTVSNRGVVRAAVVATNGANVIVKNSDIQTLDGELPADYLPTIDTAQMRSVPWMLGLSGNVRATNLLGTNTKATYINSSIASEGWGVLSTDDCTTPTLTAINSQIVTIGEDGYGSYGIGDATENFLGCTFDVATYATISRGSHLYFGDSSPQKVAELNAQLRLGLTQEELELIPNQGTIVNSQRFGIMWHGGGTSGDAGTLDIGGATELNTTEAVFLDKGQAVKIAVDGAEGAKLSSANGVILQFMDEDDPGPDPRNLQNTGVYEEPVDPVERDEGHDLTRVAEGTDAVVLFKNIELAGDFYNSTRGGLTEAMLPPPAEGVGGETTTTEGETTTTGDATTTTTVSATTTTEGTPPATDAEGQPLPQLVSISKNLGLTFDNTKITGVITASTAQHPQPTITAADYKLLGEVTNTPGAAVNNGVVVALMNGSVWTVTGTSYLTSLAIGEDCSLGAPEGKKLTLNVDGKKKSIKAGTTYTGAIELIVE